MQLSWRGANRLFLGCAAVNFVAEGHITAFTPLLLHDLGLSEPEVAVWSGLLSALMMLMALPLAPFWGVLAERFSRRPVVLRSYFTLAAALLLAAWAPNLLWLAISRMLVGLCFGTMGVIIAVQAMITPRERVGSAIAMVQAAMPVAVSVGPPLGALLIPIIGLRELFLLDALGMLIAGITLLCLMPEPAGRVKRGSVLGRTREVIGQVWTIEPIRWNFVSAMLLRGASSVIDSYLPVKITQLAADPAQAIGWILGIYGVLTTAATWLAGRLADRHDVSRLYWRSMLLGSAITVGLAAAPWLWLVGLLASLRSIPVAFSNTLLQAHIARVIPREQQTAIFSLGPVPRTLGAMILPLLAAGAASLAPGGALVVGALSYCCSSAAGFRMSQTSQRQERLLQRAATD